jgi:galactokinase
MTSLLDKSKRKETLINEFYEAYGTQPSLWSRAPGRVDLMGSHTDYNMGYVMTMTTDRDTWIAARPRSDRQVRLRSLNISGETLFSLDNLERDDVVPWSNYVRGMAQVLQEAGYELQGFDGLIHSTVPFGSGLSSSAAIEMATAVMFRQLGGFALDPVEMALLGQKAENNFVGVNTGILDQYSSAMGRDGSALLLDCRELTSEDVTIAAGLRVVICDTRAERNLVGSEYDDRRAECE